MSFACVCISGVYTEGLYIHKEVLNRVVCLCVYFRCVHRGSIHTKRGTKPCRLLVCVFQVCTPRVYTYIKRC